MTTQLAVGRTILACHMVERRCMTINYFSQELRDNKTGTGAKYQKVRDSARVVVLPCRFTRQ